MKTHERDSTGANRGNGDGKENLCSLCFLLFKIGRNADLSFSASDTASPYVDNRPLHAAGTPELREGLASGLREYKCIYVLNDAEIGNFSNEVVVNCAP
jgi:hypothetical protein